MNIKTLLFYRKFIIKTNLTEDQIKQQLIRYIVEPVRWYYFFEYGKEPIKPYWAIIRGNALILWIPYKTFINPITYINPFCIHRVKIENSVITVVARPPILFSLWFYLISVGVILTVVIFVFIPHIKSGIAIGTCVIGTITIILTQIGFYLLILLYVISKSDKAKDLFSRVLSTNIIKE